MAAQKKLYLVVAPGDPADDPIRQAHGARDHAAATAALQARFGAITGQPALQSLAAHGLPRVGDPDPNAAVVIGLSPQPADHAESLHAHIIGKGLYPTIRVGSDHRIGPADCWCPGTGQVFGTMAHAKALMGLGSPNLPSTATGAQVNVVIIDQGVNFGYLDLPASQLGSTAANWYVDPGKPTPSYEPPLQPGTAPFGHGTKMALAVLAVAPDAIIWDIPLLPPRIRGVPTYLSDAQAVFSSLVSHINTSCKSNPAPKWVLCNAWAIYDLSGDTEYATNAQAPLIQTLNHLTNADIVFAAGNCGLYCPDPRCGNGQIGPSKSIYGVAALSNVLTVGAVRNDRVWLGYSSQGPAPLAINLQGQSQPFTREKPDFCAPSQFAYGTAGIPTQGDAGWTFTGSSTACALTAGAVAAIRSGATSQPVQAALITNMRKSVTPVAGAPEPSWSLGQGILDLGKYPWTGS